MLNRLICSNRNKRVYTHADCTEDDLIQFSVDHLKSAMKLYELSNNYTWEYLHSAAFLSHLSIELLLKAWLLNLEEEFPAEHDLKRLFRKLSKRGIKLSNENKRWLNKLSPRVLLRYPDPNSNISVETDDWKRTKKLFDELTKISPDEIKKKIIEHQRYPTNVKNGKTI